MHEQDDALNIKVILLAIGGAAVAAVLVALARREEETPQAHAETVAKDVKKEAKKTAKAARKKQKEMATAAAHAGDRIADEVKEKAATLGGDVRNAERDLKAAAWDAQQEAREAESRLRAAGHRVVDDAAHLASRVGEEARHLAGEGKERIAHLRHRDDGESRVDSEVERLRAEIDELKSQLGGAGKKAEKDFLGLTSRFTGKGSAAKDDVTAQAVAAALAQLEKSLKAKAPALLAARNRNQVLEILQQDLGPTIRESAVQAAMAALGMLETGRERARDVADEGRETAQDASKDVRDKTHRLKDEARADADAAAQEAEHLLDAARANGKRRLWRSSHNAQEEAASAHRTEEPVPAAADSGAEEEHRSKSGLFWGGAGLGLALYALLDTERREKVLRMANEASVQVQELVRDLQGYDDEF